MKSIMSVDDSAQVRNIIKGAANVLGYPFLEAADGEEGLALIRARKDDIGIVLLDVNMPKMLGFDVLKAVKGDPETRHIPIVMVTTESEREAIINAVRTGASNYITKPFSQEELITKIAETLGLGFE